MYSSCQNAMPESQQVDICFSGPPIPPVTVRVSERSSVITHFTILFNFNCSWFSDVNGAIRFFTVIVTESNGTSHINLIFPEFEFTQILMLFVPDYVSFKFHLQMLIMSCQSIDILCHLIWTTDKTTPSKRTRPATFTACVQRDLTAGSVFLR